MHCPTTDPKILIWMDYGYDLLSLFPIEMRNESSFPVAAAEERGDNLVNSHIIYAFLMVLR